MAQQYGKATHLGSAPPAAAVARVTAWLALRLGGHQHEDTAHSNDLSGVDFD
jgi:hypothetical protein